LEIKNLSKNELLSLKEELSAQYGAFKAQGLALDMSRGKPGKDQLDLSQPLLDELNSGSDIRCEGGTDCRNYGIVDGIPEAKRLFAQLFGLDTDEVLIGGNSSLNMMFDTIAQAMVSGVGGSEPWLKQGDVKFLCPAPGYDRHFAICEYFGIQMISVPMKETGPDMDVVERLAASDPSIKGIWCVPKYSNPQGITYSKETVQRFAALKPAAADFRIFWDNAYCVHQLFGEDEQLLNLINEAKKYGNEDRVYMYYSTSKITFPGAGVAGMAASKANLNEIKKRLTIQTIGHDKLNQLRHVRYLKDLEGLKAQMEKQAVILRPKFEAVLSILKSELGGTGIAYWTEPKGGYFVSVDVEQGTAKRVVQLCKEAGVVLTGAGATFPYGKDPLDRNIRIAPTFPPVSELETAMQLFCICAKLAAVEGYLGE
jgi:aspartate/methionine/tyrosine aminotransferase